MKNTFLAVLALLFLLFLLTPASAGGQEKVAPKVGSHLPPLRFRDLAGMTHRVDWSSPERKAIVILFFEPRCADCFRELVFFDGLCRLARGLNFEVFAVEASGQEPLEVEATISRFVSMFQGPAFTVVPDPSYALSTLLNVQRMPSTFLMETHGVVIDRKEGFDNFHAIDLARKIERLLDLGKGKLSPALAHFGISSQEEHAFERALEERNKVVDSGALHSALLTAGTRVAPFEFVDLSGVRGTWSPADSQRKATVVFFWGALCEPCIREMSYLDQLRSAAGGSGLDVIAVEATGLALERVSLVMERYRKFHPAPSHSVVADPDRQLSRHFGVGGALPQTFVIGGDGTVLYHTDEFIQGGERTLAGKIEQALGLETATLSEGAKSATSSAEESPTVLKGLSGKGELFTSSLLQAETLYRNWQYTAAIPYYRRCLEVDPKNAAVRERLADIFQRQGELELALEEWEHVLRLDPGSSEAARRIDNLRERLGPKPPDER